MERAPNRNWRGISLRGPVCVPLPLPSYPHPSFSGREVVASDEAASCPKTSISRTSPHTTGQISPDAVRSSQRGPATGPSRAGTGLVSSWPRTRRCLAGLCRATGSEICSAGRPTRFGLPRLSGSGFDLRHGRLCGAAVDADPANARFAFVHAIALRCRRRIRPMSISLRRSFRRPCNAWTCREPPISHGIPPPCAPTIRASQRSSAACPDDGVSRPSTSGGRVFPCGARRESPQAARMTFIAFSRAALPKTS